MKISTYGMDQLEFDFCLEAPFPGTSNIIVEVFAWHTDRLERLDIFYRGVDVEELIQHMDAYARIIDQAKEEIAKRLAA